MGQKYKTGICERCGDYGYVNDHHIVPKGVTKFNNKETIRLCLKCHVEIHELLPDDLKKPNEINEFTLKWIVEFI